MTSHRAHHPGRRHALRVLAASAATGIGGLLPVTTYAADTAWPTQRVRLVVPFAAGGSTDALARLLAQKLHDTFGQPFIVENRGGANGNLGAAAVTTSPPDGYTLLFSTTGPLSINKLLYRNTPFDPLTNFTPISLIADVPLLIAAHPSFPANDVKQLLEYLKANPGKVTYSTGGNGSMGHLAAMLLQRATGTSLVHVPYKGSAGALNDLLAGVVNLSFDLVPTYLQHITAGKLKPLAVLGSQRSSSLPATPTLKELGIDVNATGWYGLAGPKGLPADIVNKVNAATNAFLASPEGRKQLEVYAMRGIGGPPDALKTLMRTETEKWRSIVEPIAATLME